MVKDLNVAYIGTFYPHHARPDLLEMKSMGCTSINMCVNEADWHYYHFSRREIRKAAKELGIKVYLNFHGFGAFAATFPGHTYQMRHPESVQISNKGNKGQYNCCPNNSEYNAWLTVTLSELIQDLDPDGVFWDEPRFTPCKDYPEEWACSCSYCQDAFEEQYGKPMPNQLTPEVIAFRQDSLLLFLDRLMTMAKQLKPDMENVLCLMPFDRKNEGQLTPGWYGVVDWEPFIALQSVDVFSTDPYWIHRHDLDYFDSNTKEMMELSSKYGKPCQLWVQSIWIEPGKEHLIGETILRAEQMGVDRIAVWAYRGESGSHYLNWGANPDDCWQQVVQAYKTVSQRMGSCDR